MSTLRGLWRLLLASTRDMAPIVLVIAFFQVVILQQPFPNPDKVIIGLVFVIGGLTLFVRGLETGLFPIFFGRPASTVRSPAVLALKYDVPLFPTEIYRSNGRHVIHFDEPIEPGDLRDGEAPVEAITQAVTGRLEGFIRRHPDQWMWLHKRWRTRPEKAKRKG